MQVTFDPTNKTEADAVLELLDGRRKLFKLTDSLEDLGLRGRTLAALTAANVNNIGQLASQKIAVLTELPDFGPTSLEKVTESLRLCGLTLEDSD